MLLLLLHLLLLTLMKVEITQGVSEGQMFTVSSELDISSCPITFYGKTYKSLYVNFTSNNFVACFNGFYNPKTKADCIFGPPLRDVGGFFLIHPVGPVFEEYFRHMPSITTQLQCVVDLQVTDEESAFILGLFNFGAQAALYLFNNIQESSTFDIQVDGTTVKTLNIFNAGSFDDYKLMDVSGCRHSGVLYKPGTALSSDPETCISVMCSEAAVLILKDCGPYRVL